MKIRKTYRLFALSMSLLMLITSVGISADFHFCQGEFKNFALFTKAKSCHEIAAMHASCHKSESKTTSCHKAEVSCAGEEEDGCCNNKTELLQLDIDYSFGELAIENLNDFQNDLAILPNKPRLKYSSISYPAKYQNYKPPLLTEDLSIRFQSFLC